MRQTRKDYRKRTWPAGTNTPGMKQVANSKLRRTGKDEDSIPQGGGYKKTFESYDINDFK